MAHTIGSILLGLLLAYAIFSDEIEIEEPEKPKTKKKKTIKVKRNGQWVDEDI